MSFEEFVKCYKEDIRPRIRTSTYEEKQYIIDNKILPYFKNRSLDEITTTDVLQWQNEMLRMRVGREGKPYAKSYLKTLHNQLTAIFNHAVKYYKLKENPARIVGNMGSEKDIKMKFWTLEEYQAFSEAMMDKPVAFYAFEVLYWCGLRLGEMLALTAEDWNFERKTVSVNKTYYRSKGKDIITDPKTPKSVRDIVVPDFLLEEIKDYLSQCYDLPKNSRMFPISKNFMEREMVRGAKIMNLQKIRIHDLRHSHVSLLIDRGYSAVAIADRLGHESIDITYRYAHMFPNVQADMAKDLDRLREGS